MTTENARLIAENVQRVRSQVQEAAAACGRREAEITTVVVTKYVGVAEVRALILAGCRDFGESRPQQLWSKTEALKSLDSGDSIRWHLVGHLQRNKAGRTVPLVSLIHSVDSIRLLQSIEQVSSQRSEPTPILLEVNISADAAKHGFSPDQIDPLVQAMPNYPHVKLRGLMAMAGLGGGRDRAHQDFERLRQLRDRLQPNCPPGATLQELSMGMSGDFDLAIAHGATIVRIGSAFFEGLAR